MCVGIELSKQWCESCIQIYLEISRSFLLSSSKRVFLILFPSLFFPSSPLLLYSTDRQLTYSKATMSKQVEHKVLLFYPRCFPCLKDTSNLTLVCSSVYWRFRREGMSTSSATTLKQSVLRNLAQSSIYIWEISVSRKKLTHTIQQQLC